MNDYTDLLSARPSFLEGMARLLDFSGTLNEYNRSLTPEQADALALAADWWAVGNDLRAVLGRASPTDDDAPRIADGERDEPR